MWIEIWSRTHCPSGHRETRTGRRARGCSGPRRKTANTIILDAHESIEGSRSRVGHAPPCSADKEPRTIPPSRYAALGRMALILRRGRCGFCGIRGERSVEGESHRAGTKYCAGDRIHSCSSFFPVAPPTNLIDVPSILGDPDRVATKIGHFVIKIQVSHENATQIFFNSNVIDTSWCRLLSTRSDRSNCDGPNLPILPYIKMNAKNLGIYLRPVEATLKVVGRVVFIAFTIAQQPRLRTERPMAKACRRYYDASNDR